MMSAFAVFGMPRIAYRSLDSMVCIEKNSMHFIVTCSQQEVRVKKFCSVSRGNVFFQRM